MCFRINMSHTPHDKMRELVKTIRNVEVRVTVARSASSSTCRDRSCASASSKAAQRSSNNGQSLTLDSDKTPRRQESRVSSASGDSRALRPGHTLLLDDGKVRLIAEETSPERAVNARRGRRQDERPQGRQPARHGFAGIGDDAKGPRGPRGRGHHRHRLDRSLLCSAPTTSGSQAHESAAAPWSWPRSRSRRRSTASPTSSRSRCADGWRAAISAWNCRWSAFRACKNR